MKTIYSVMVGVGLALAVARSDAQDINKPISLEIDSKVLRDALNDWAQQTGFQLIVPSLDVTAHFVVARVEGQLTPIEALERMLAGTQLTYELLNDQLVAIKERNTPLALPATRNDEQFMRVPLLRLVGDPITTTATTGEARPTADSAQISDTASESKEPTRGGLEEILVTTSRIGRNRFDSPTPVMVLGADTLQEGSRPNIAAALNDMPQFRGTFSAQNTGVTTVAGQAPVDLRGLGLNRTLVLLDGRRFAGDADLAQVPSVLVERLDVVTGSASAAWGSGAVAGVVNIVLDDDLNGLRIGAQGAVSDRDDNEEGRFEIAGGTGFAGGRGHVVLGGEYVEGDGIQPRTERENVGRWAAASNPAYTPTNGQHVSILVPDVGYADASVGGLILSGVNAGRTFNPDGTLRAFDFGRMSGTNSVGGEGPSLDDIGAAVAPVTRFAALGRATFDITDAVSISADIRHAQSYGDFDLFPDSNRGNITISAENAFLPATIRNQMQAAGETSFRMGRFNSDYALVHETYKRKSTQATVALDGSFAETWRWNAYYTHGTYDEYVGGRNVRRVANFTNAVDSVLSASGQPICRIALQNPATDCVPINLFGEGTPSPQARAYILGSAFRNRENTLDSGSISLQGEPFSTWAGPVSTAFGVEGRREALDVTATSATPAQNPFAFFAFLSTKGDFNVKEGFVEVLVPLAKEVPALELLEFNGAARISDYSTSGSIWSWKLGLSNKLTESLRLRAVHSRDIRSPNLQELYNTPLISFFNVTDPLTGLPSGTVVHLGGNPLLEPEVSRTTTFGMTFTPSSIPTLSFSADYFDIELEEGIVTLGAQEVVNRCARGNQNLCNGVVRGSNGLITDVFANGVNLAQIMTSGIDAQMDYALDLNSFSPLPGTVRLRGVVTWVKKFETYDGVSRIDFRESQNGPLLQFGLPKLGFNAGVYYDLGSTQTNVRVRYVSAGNQDNNVDLQNNRIPAYTYVDVGFKVTFGGFADVDVYANINNVFDKDPPINSGSAAFYDIVGRYGALGIRARF